MQSEKSNAGIGCLHLASSAVEYAGFAENACAGEFPRESGSNNQNQPLTPKIGFLAQKSGSLAQNQVFWPKSGFLAKIGVVGPKWRWLCVRCHFTMRSLSFYLCESYHLEEGIGVTRLCPRSITGLENINSENHSRRWSTNRCFFFVLLLRGCC